MLDEIKARMEAEVESLMHELRVILPEAIGKALELGDLRENSEHKSAIERKEFVEARIGHLSRRLSELARIDVKAMPADRAGFGSRVTLLELEVREELTVTLVAGDYMDLDGGQVSLASPIGQSLIGCQPGETVTIRLPRGERRYQVKALVTLPQQLGLVD